MISKTTPQPQKGFSLAYRYSDGLYLNTTNRCPTACVFCVKRPWQWSYRGWNLKLNKEPSAPEILAEVKKAFKANPMKEVVFCGYGEPTYRLDAIKAVGKEIAQEFPGLKRRLNTVGLGSMIWKRNIVPDLKGHVDAVSVSLNTADPEEWLRLQRPAPAYRNGFTQVILFIKECVGSGLETRVTAVQGVGADPGAVRDVARSLGARYLLRPRLEDENHGSFYGGQ